MRLWVLVALVACKPSEPGEIDADGDGSFADVDCDDDDPLVNPVGFEEPYNGVDDDCDPLTLDDDLDEDGVLLAEDCDDRDATVSPEVEETPYDGIDNDCDPGTPDDDLDGDGFGVASDCADGNPDIHPDADEIYYDGIDNDCDPLQTIDDDQDRDQVPADIDCDDEDPLLREGPTYFPDCDGDGFAAESAVGMAACAFPPPPAACPDGSWTIVEPVGPPADVDNTTLDCSDSDGIAHPDQQDFSTNPVHGVSGALAYDVNCDGELTPEIGPYQCNVVQQGSQDPFCTSVPGMAADTACGTEGTYLSGCEIVGQSGCAAVTTEPRVQGCR